MDTKNLVKKYLVGASLLRDAVEGMTDKQIDTAPIPSKWSTRQVVCHLADFEIVYADRMKRVIAEEQPKLFVGGRHRFAARLAYDERNIEDELRLIETIRNHMCHILRPLKPEDFQRNGIHSETGPITLATLLTNVTNHIPHHVAFIEDKKKAMLKVTR